MSRLIKKFSNQSILEFDKGKFDDWCIYHKLLGKERYAPKDIQYFTRLKKLSEVFSPDIIYNDFLEIYEKTTKEINISVLSDITNVSAKYKNYALQMDIIFTILYAGMVAEENKAKAILKKRIKRLGMHQLLREGYTPQVASIFSKGKNWRELDKECLSRGF